MKIKHHFCCAFRDELKKTLDQLSIPYESFSMHPVREDSYLIGSITKPVGFGIAVIGSAAGVE